MDDIKLETTSKEERTWAMFAHLSGFAIYLTGIGHIVGPLVIWLMNRDGHPFVDDQGKEALNFNITYSIYWLAAIILFFTIIGALVAIPMFFILPTLHIVAMIIAAIKANEGVAFRYPAIIRFVK